MEPIREPSPATSASAPAAAPTAETDTVISSDQFRERSRDLFPDRPITTYEFQEMPIAPYMYLTCLVCGRPVTRPDPGIAYRTNDTETEIPDRFCSDHKRGSA